MRFVNGSQSCGSISLTAVLLISTAVISPGAALSVAQESAVQVDDFTRSFPTEIALAKIEADGHSPSDARQLLQDRLSKAYESSKHANSSEIDLVNQQLFNVQEFGLKQLLYSMLVVEVPTEDATAIVENWDLVGSSTSTTQKINSGNLLKYAGVPASVTASTTTYECRISAGLSEEQITELVGMGNVIRAPTIVGENGAEVNVRVGCDLQCVTGYKRGKDDSGNDRATMQPMIRTMHEGIKLVLIGTFDDKKENVKLDFRFTDTQSKGTGNPFTYEATDGGVTVQQPEFASTGIQASCTVPTNKTIALCGGRIKQELVVERGVLPIRQIPYLGKLFKSAEKATDSSSKIILIRVQELNATSPSYRKT
jgi:type II secretory pathway component GspD/PulD (secretin)